MGLSLVTAFLALRIIDAFEPRIAQPVARTALMPVVARAAGNIRKLTTALPVRAIARGQAATQNTLA